MSRIRNPNLEIMYKCVKSRVLSCEFSEHIFDGWFDILIGGKKYSTTIDTLTQREPDSMLAAMFSGRHRISQDSETVSAIFVSGVFFFFFFFFL